ncbi:MAG: helix-turn-helix domain-containing protein [Myxococcaceae bacterium]
MPTTKRADPKSDALRERGAFNPRPERVTDELFRQSEFFDARDLPQVKYEMLRRVQQEGVAVARAAEAFGFSRPSFYGAQAAFAAAGLSGLLPKKRGPRGAHKLNAEVMRFVEEVRAKDLSVTASTLVPQVKKRFGIEVHPRSVERALARQEKKRR